MSDMTKKHNVQNLFTTDIPIGCGVMGCRNPPVYLKSDLSTEK